MALQPNYPVVNLGDLYVQGGRMAYSTTTAFTVAAGQFRDSTNINDIVIAASTVSISSNGLNALDTGTIAASTIYYVYAIGSSIYGADNGQDNAASQGNSGSTTYPDNYLPAGCIISLVNGQPTLPFGYDMWRRIGAIRTTAGSAIEPFTQTGFGKNRTMRYQTPVAPGAAATAGTTSYATIGALLAIVPQIPVDVIIEASLAPATAGDSLYLAPYGNTVAPGGYQNRMSAVVIEPTAQYMQMICPGAFNAAATPVIEVDYATTAGAGTTAVTFVVTGYIDVI